MDVYSSAIRPPLDVLHDFRITKGGKESTMRQIQTALSQKQFGIGHVDMNFFS